MSTQPRRAPRARGASASGPPDRAAAPRADRVQDGTLAALCAFSVIAVLLVWGLLARSGAGLEGGAAGAPARGAEGAEIGLPAPPEGLPEALTAPLPELGPIDTSLPERPPAARARPWLDAVTSASW